jgi:hypothetical protein
VWAMGVSVAALMGGDDSAGAQFLGSVLAPGFPRFTESIEPVRLV